MPPATETKTILTPGLPDAQEVFDTMIATMRANGKRIKDEPCVYRADGMKSAIGSLIPDAEWTSALEGQLIFDLIQRSVSPLSKETIDLLIKHLSLCITMRSTENLVEPRFWEEQFAKYAHEHRLLYVPIDVEVEPEPTEVLQ